MSYTTLIVFRGDKREEIEFRNAWGGAARIWDALFAAYIPKLHQYDSWVCGQQQRLWDLYKNKNVPPLARAVHMFTFDKFYVERLHFQRFAMDLTSFVEIFPTKGMQVDHLPAWADEFRKSDADAIGLYGTSVGENLWRHYDEEKDTSIELPLSDGWEVYQQLELVEHEHERRSADVR